MSKVQHRAESFASPLLGRRSFNRGSKEMINRIDGPRTVSTTTPLRKKEGPARARGSSTFSRHLDETEGASCASGASALGAVSGVWDLQEVDDALERAARGKLRAEDLLSKLDDLRMDLLSGSLSRSKLERLAQTVNKKREEVTDPKLNQILDEIDLRAQVELAKFTRTL